MASEIIANSKKYVTNLYSSVSTRDSRENRISKYKGASLLQIRNMRAKVSKFADTLGFVDVAESRELTQNELQDLMEEYQSLTDAAEIATARRERIKEMLFTHFDLTGETELEVNNKLFKREGGNIKDPTFDWDKLDDKIYDAVVEVEHKFIPHLDELKLDAWLRDHPEDMEKVRKALIPGERNSFKFAVRDVKDDGDS